MSKKTLNIAATCLVLLMMVFVITKKNSDNRAKTSNITVDGEVVEENKTVAETYQAEVLQALLAQNIKSFEAVSESFKRKPTDTLSDTIAKNTFSEYINYNTTQTLDVEKIKAETEAALKQNIVTKSNVGVDKITISSNTISGLKEYGNRISIIQNEMLKAVNKEIGKENIQIYIKNIYKTTADLYIKIPVPESLVEQHLGVINAYRDYATGFELLELQSKDPAKAIVGVQTAKEAHDALIENFTSIKKIVLLNKITYTKNDPAYVWFLESTESIKLN